ncbi:hypothetical protein COCCADRAFT_21723 [Bipolaris zeicola 26-R-13]|uniref:Secreted protein n=1 Tax=Cochliobolus carbonum (strain 26-R-13) TaxID=930089 RepID=W6YME8_COCC2|nr:uncharacterized protein COCCADRAFT_21723 [Bipolaris zeicola 26-R-13]EUC38985.1 hypothetical protein COCCADRAFT_21723 [Bipolaris zeicola 26-R-13]
MPTRLPLEQALGHRSLLACLLARSLACPPRNACMISRNRPPPAQPRHTHYWRVGLAGGSIPGPHRDPSSAGTRLHPSISLPPWCHPSDPLGVSLSRTDMPTPSSLLSLAAAPSAPRARLILACWSLVACLSPKHHNLLHHHLVTSDAA